MIFATVGGQLPFDRLVKSVDMWSSAHEDQQVFAQIGNAAFVPQHAQWRRFLNRQEFSERMNAASVIVSHAGMGTILTALELRKPILVLPRRRHLREHRNDHQWATVKHLRSSWGVQVAEDEDQLLRRLDELDQWPTAVPAQSAECQKLVEFLRSFVSG